MSNWSPDLNGLAAAYWSRVSYQNLNFDAPSNPRHTPLSATSDSFDTTDFDVTPLPARFYSSPTRRHKKTTIPEKAKAEVVLSTKSKLPLTYTAVSPHAIIAQG